MGFEHAGESVTLIFEGRARASGEVLIGADGVHSRIRELLFGPDAPVFTGCVAWRGLVPTSDLPSRLRHSVGTNWVGPGAHVVHYPVRTGELLNFVGIVERDDWQVESWTESGTRKECARDFAGWHAEVQEIIQRLDRPYKWALMGAGPFRSGPWDALRFSATLATRHCHSLPKAR